MFAGTDTISMFKEASFDKPLSVVWPLKTSQMSIAFWVGGNFYCWRVFTRYGLMMESISLRVSSSFE